MPTASPSKGTLIRHTPARPTHRQKSGKSELAYKIQPRPEKWVCARCGRTPKKKEKGAPEFTQTSFASRKELLAHVGREHCE